MSETRKDRFDRLLKQYLGPECHEAVDTGDWTKLPRETFYRKLAEMNTQTFPSFKRAITDTFKNNPRFWLRALPSAAGEASVPSRTGPEKRPCLPAGREALELSRAGQGAPASPGARALSEPEPPGREGTGGELVGSGA